MSKPIVVFKNVRLTLASRAGPVSILRDVDLEAQEGQSLAIVGPSGSGKTSLLMVMAGLERASGGKVTVAGHDLSGLSEDELTLMRGAEIGIVFQSFHLVPTMTALENVAVPLEFAGRADAFDRAEAALREVGLGHRLGHYPGQLSGGEQQRLALAGTLALRPGLLLLDEPTANLDPDGAAGVREVLDRVLERVGATLVLVEHRVDEAVSLVDRVVVLEAGGGVVADGRPREVFGEHGSALAAAGVWVPDHPPPPPPRRTRGTPAALVLAERVAYRYPGERADAVSGVDLQLRSGEALAITGPNGSGKSTLALLLAGLLAPRVGSVLATEALSAGHGHEPIATWRAHELVQRIGTVFQDPEHQFLTASVRDELLLGPRRAGASEPVARHRADELLERLHLAPLAQANPFTLSGGEKRRLSVATALATAPALLVLDEPTFGQDRRTWSELLQLLAALRDDGRGIGFVTHDRAFAAALADRTLTLARHAA